MKFFTTFLFLFSIGLSDSQTKATPINWKNLTGSWKLEKSLKISEGDTTVWNADTVTVIYSFLEKSKFKEVSSYMKNTVFTGSFHVDELQKKISFTEMIQTTTFPGTAYKDFVCPSPWPEILVLKLKAGELTVKCSESFDGGPYADVIYYLKKEK